MPDMPPPSLQPGTTTASPGSNQYGTVAYWNAERQAGRPTPEWYRPPDAGHPTGYILGTQSYFADQDSYRNAQGAPVGGGTGGASGTEALQQQTGLGSPFPTSDELRKRLLSQQGGRAGMFADQSQQRYEQYGQQAGGALAGLQAQANGQNSVSALQLRQGLQQNLAAQRAQAASAAPQNAAMAARTAAIQSSRLGAGLAGQQAVAGLQERNQAQQNYGQLLQGLRGQDLNAATSGRAAAANAYGAGSSGPPAPGWWDQNGKYVTAGATALGAAISDRRLKRDIRDGDESADKAIKGLRSFMFRYKDDQHGKGDQLGVMAQDLERAGLKHAVIDTPIGKVVHGAKLATANTAMISALGRRLAKLEGGGK